MQLPEGFHLIRQDFQIPLAEGKSLSRFVHMLVVDREQTLLIDAGVTQSHVLIEKKLHQLGKDWSQLSMLLLSHAHPDHFGGAPEILKRSGCSLGIHSRELDWIECPQHQFEERPVPGFFSLIEGEVQAELMLDYGKSNNLPGGCEPVEAPGHSPGHMHFRFPQQGVLFSADSLLQPGGYTGIPSLFYIGENAQSAVKGRL